MKKDIHPDYVICEVTCGCGEHFVTRSTRPVIRVEVCSKCHPFYTGKQKFVDSAGRVEKFQKRWGAHVEEQKARIMGEFAKPPEAPDTDDSTTTADTPQEPDPEGAETPGDQ